MQRDDYSISSQHAIYMNELFTMSPCHCPFEAKGKEQLFIL